MSNLMSTVHPYDLNIVGGSDSYLFDDKNKSYLDFWGDEGCNSLGNGWGYGDSVKEVIMEFINRKLPIHIPKMYGDKYKEQLALALCHNAGMHDGSVIFSNSGTEANEAAIKLARKYWYNRDEPYRWNVATLKGNFHGRTGFSLAASDSSDSKYHKLGFGEMAGGFYKFSTIDELYRLSEMPGGLACVMMATILGNNCIEVYPQSCFEELRRFRNETGTLILFDEVQVSRGSTGKFMAYQNFDIFLDLDTIVKGMPRVKKNISGL